jgi:hypothetical protein
MDAVPIYWIEIFCYIDWARNNRGGSSIGEPALRFMGLLGEAMKDQWPMKLPRARAIMMLLECWRASSAHIVFHSSKTSYWVESTPLGEKELGVQIKVELLPHSPKMLGDDLWDLSVRFR